MATLCPGMNLVCNYCWELHYSPSFSHYYASHVVRFESVMIIWVIWPRGISYKSYVFLFLLYKYKSYLQKPGKFSSFTDNFILLLTIFIDIYQRNEQNDKIYFDRYSTEQPPMNIKRSMFGYILWSTSLSHTEF